MIPSTAVVKAQVRRRPPAVQEVLRIIATKRSIEAEDRVEVLEGEDEHYARLFTAAIKEWDEWWSKAKEVGVGEVEFAEALIDRLRKNPQHGWDRILRGRAN